MVRVGARPGGKRYHKLKDTFHTHPKASPKPAQSTQRQQETRPVEKINLFHIFLGQLMCQGQSYRRGPKETGVRVKEQEGNCGGTPPPLTILLLVPLQGQKEAPPGNSQNTDIEVGVRFYKVAIWKVIYLSLKYATLHISQAD